MASFTMVEQITNMASTNTKIATSLNTSNAVGLIGRTVTYIDADGETLKTGKVERVATSRGRRLHAHHRRCRRHRPVVHHRSRLIRRPHEQGALPLMMRGMFAAISGLKQHQVMLDVTANDIANVNTIGYKSRARHLPGLADPDAARRRRPGAATTAAPTRAQVGLGVGLGSIDNLMTGGAVQTTGNPLDVAIQGDGFFQIGEGTPTAGDIADHADRLHARRQLLDQLRRAS